MEEVKPMPWLGKKTRPVQFLVTDAEHEEITKKRESLGLTTGQYLLSLHHEHMGRKQFQESTD